MNITLLALLAVAQAQDEPTEEATDYHDVVLVDDGPTKMADKRDYSAVFVPGVTLFPPGFKGRLQFMVGEKTSLIVGGGIAGGLLADADASVSEWMRWQVVGGLDYHPIGNGLHGFFFGPRVIMRHGQLSLWELDSITDTLIVRGLVGYRVVLDPGVMLSVGVGGAYRRRVRFSRFYDEAEASALLATVPALELNVGWAF